MTSLKYGDAEGYDAYMGGWSTALSPLFLQFVGLDRPSHVLDIGCGTGNLLAGLRAAHPDAVLVGLDPSSTLLDKARRRADLVGVALVEGAVERLPFPDSAFDCCLSLLVLQEFSNLPAALLEMRRVTRALGSVAACQWDFARMPVIDALVAAITAVNPAAGGEISGGSAPTLADERALADAWTQAGFTKVHADRVAVTRAFPRFDDLWLPLLSGSTPSTLKLASLARHEQDEVRSQMRAKLLVDQAEAPLLVTAEALVVRGRV